MGRALSFLAVLGLAWPVGLQAFELRESLVQYKGRPALLAPGLPRLPIAYADQLWAPRTDPKEAWPPREPRPADEAVIRALAKKWALKDPNALICLDIEHWRVDRSREEAEKTQARVLKVLGWVREEAPHLRVGIYGMLPTHMMDKDLAGPQERISAVNQRIAGMYNAVDVLFIDTYSMGWGLKHWQDHVAAVVAQCRAFKKPLYLFVRPRRRDKEDAEVYGAEEWTSMLGTCARLADGAIIWEDGHGRPWDPSLPWIQASLAFANKGN